LERKLDLFLEQKLWIGNAIAHLDKILESEVGDRVGIGSARVLEFAEQIRPDCAVPVEKLQEAGTIFEGTVHALTEERNDGMSRIAKQ
jgi:hypothetical protein